MSNLSGLGFMMVVVQCREDAAKKADSKEDVTAQEREIDQLVYKLYGLTGEEIRVVDPASHEATQGRGGGREC